VRHAALSEAAIFRTNRGHQSNATGGVGIGIVIVGSAGAVPSRLLSLASYGGR
jgi:hypothetical protein